MLNLAKTICTFLVVTASTLTAGFLIVTIHAAMSVPAAVAQGQRQTHSVTSASVTITDDGRVVRLDEEFVRIAEEVPGFGGYYHDSEGVLHVLLTDLYQEAKLSLGGVSLMGRDDVRVELARYGFLELYRWKTALQSFLLPDVVYIDINVRTNRVQVGVTQEGLKQVEDALAQLDFPREAIELAVDEPMFPGGMRIASASGAICTMFNTNSRCIPAPFRYDGASFDPPGFADDGDELSSTSSTSEDPALDDLMTMANEETSLPTDDGYEETSPPKDDGYEETPLPVDAALGASTPSTVSGDQVSCPGGLETLFHSDLTGDGVKEIVQKRLPYVYVKQGTQCWRYEIPGSDDIVFGEVRNYVVFGTPKQPTQVCCPLPPPNYSDSAIYDQDGVAGKELVVVRKIETTSTVNTWIIKHRTKEIWTFRADNYLLQNWKNDLDGNAGREIFLWYQSTMPAALNYGKAKIYNADTRKLKTYDLTQLVDGAGYTPVSNQLVFLNATTAAGKEAAVLSYPSKGSSFWNGGWVKFVNHSLGKVKTRLVPLNNPWLDKGRYQVSTSHAIVTSSSGDKIKLTYRVTEILTGKITTETHTVGY